MTNYTFIRTIDGIYKVPRVENYDSYVRIYGFILKHSDYIDELFNRVVRWYKKHYKILSMKSFNSLSRKELLKEMSKGAVYYGSVWTKTGLKYAAQYTIEGDWKLLWDTD